uniref:CCHC-type domain-containing protein n=1 Tax=Magallana gigas TaxID=29159 RepID=A0A8W8MJW0_MAGGI
MGDSGDEMNIDVDKLPKDSTGETSSLEISDIVKLFTGPFPAFQQQQQQPFLYGQGRNKQSRRQPMPYDVCFNCFATGHWKSNCPKGKATQSQ